MMTLTQFKELSKAAGSRDRIVAVDDLLADYNAEFARSPRNYGNLLTAISAMQAACVTYTQRRPNSGRAAGVTKLQQCIKFETAVLRRLDDAQRAGQPSAKGRAVMLAQEAFMEGQREQAGLNPYIALLSAAIRADWTELDQSLGFADNTTEDGKTLVREDIQMLQAIAEGHAAPGLIRVMLRGILAARNLQQLAPSINHPGAKYNLTRDGNTPKYTLKHQLMYDGGVKNRLGALTHELTHVAVAEAYGNTVLMFAIARGATDEQWMALSRSRRAALTTLKDLAERDTELNNAVFSRDYLSNNIVAKCNYALECKILTYLATFKLQLEQTEGLEFIPRVKNLVLQGLGSELIEYDSVINQMLMWCWMHHVSYTNPVFVSLQNLAAAEMIKRSRQAPKPQLVAARPLPKPRTVGAVQRVQPPQAVGMGSA